MRRFLFLFLGLLLLLSLAGLTKASSLETGESGNRERWLKAEPVRLALEASLGADEWDDKPENKEKKKKSATELKSSGKKSRTKAILLSALVPGAGAYYLGQKNKARYFLAAEALTLASLFWFDLNAAWAKDDVIRYGNAHASASLEGKPDSFLEMVGFYDNNDHYNSEGRVGDPDRPYYPSNSDYHWAWQSDAERLTYKELQNAETSAVQRTRYMIGVAVLNRILSMIDTAISSRKMASSGSDEFALENPGQFKLSLNPTATNRQLVVTWHTSLF